MLVALAGFLFLGGYALTSAIFVSHVSKFE
jgi:hypothetical protein